MAFWTNDFIVGRFINRPAKSISSKESTTTNITKLPWHTGPGCFLTPESDLTGAAVSHPPDFFSDNVSKATVKATPTATERSLSNTGCDVSEWSRALYGKDFNLQGGGVFAMKWDENKITRIGTLDPLTSPPTFLFTSSHVNKGSFFRAAVPADIICGTPSQWGSPVAALEPGGCDLIKDFVNHLIVFDSL
ncbi:hypothetical protein K435DRAFT_969081 [Dendrothele bispora CBS 962.96]|uniref:Uncharacterized protein n=1 Tax=Dendrothele bispora (strain CBS 962.96) TaxID=1314807 RepID=A0A4S8LJW1_DENBC|nr:hypothetical protein K435DRAFT_969081 [Dendrothele bispora CBS 962.96]